MNIEIKNSQKPVKYDDALRIMETRFSINAIASSYFTGFCDFLISIFIYKLYSFHYVLKDPTE